MRLIGHLPAEADAKRFVDYLLTRRIAAHAESPVSSPSAPWEVWIEDDDQLDAGRDELRQYQAAPADPRYDAAADSAATLRKQQEQAAAKRQANYRDVRTTMFAAPNAATPVTLTVIGICVALYVVTHFGGATGDRFLAALLFDNPVGEITGRWAMFDSVAKGQLWRLFTPALLHGGVLHVLFNMMWMLDLGRRIEPNKGSGKLIGLILSIALLSNVAQAGWTVISPFSNDHYSTFLGLSGVVAGLFGYAWACGRFRPYERVGVTQYETGWMLGWLAICSVGFVGPIANAAHWGGLVVGFLIGAAPSLIKHRRA